MSNEKTLTHVSSQPYYSCFIPDAILDSGFNVSHQIHLPPLNPPRPPKAASGKWTDFLFSTIYSLVRFFTKSNSLKLFQTVESFQNPLSIETIALREKQAWKALDRLERRFGALVKPNSSFGNPGRFGKHRKQKSKPKNKKSMRSRTPPVNETPLPLDNY